MPRAGGPTISGTCGSDVEFAVVGVETIDTNPRQPRTVFADDDLDELSASIREVGLVQPIAVPHPAEPGGC